MNLVQNDEAILICLEKQCGIGQFAAVRARFQVEIERVRAFGDLKGQGRLAGLARAGHGDGRLPTQGVQNRLVCAATYHPCKLNEKILICKNRGIDCAERAGDPFAAS